MSRQFSPASGLTSRLPQFIRRAFHVDQMEFDSAISQMYSLLVRPTLVAKMSKARSMTKNHYHRDDPAFVVLQVLFIVVAAIAWGILCGCGFTSILSTVLFRVAINYLAAGVIVSTATWVLVLRYFIGAAATDPTSGAVGDPCRDLEWQYSLDVHFNGFFVYFMWTKVAAYVLTPLTASEGSFIARVLANGIMLIGACGYVYSVFLGYLELPMLTQQQRLLAPIPFFVVLFVLVTLFTSYSATVSEIEFLYGARWSNDPMTERMRRF